MKMLLIFLFNIGLNAQPIFTETFSNFFTADTMNMRGFWVLDSSWHEAKNGGTQIIQDIGSLNNDITIVGWATYGALRDSLASGSVMYSGGQALKFLNTANKYLNCGTSATLNFTGSYTIGVVFKTHTTIPNIYAPILTRENATGAPAINYDFFVANAAAANKVDFATGNAVYHDLLSGVGCSASTWYVVVAVWDETGKDKYLYLNQAVIPSLDIAVGAEPESRPTDATYIGHLDRTGDEFAGQVACVFISDSLYAVKAAKEFGYIARKWKSNSGGVTRSLFAFTQGVVSDTIYFDSLLTAGNWSISVNIDGNSGGETYRILTSSDRSIWSDLATGIAPASSTTTTITGAGLGYIGLAVSSATDTVFFDNLTVSETSIAAANSNLQFLKFLTFSIFK